MLLEFIYYPQVKADSRIYSIKKNRMESYVL